MKRLHFCLEKPKADAARVSSARALAGENGDRKRKREGGENGDRDRKGGDLAQQQAAGREGGRAGPHGQSLHPNGTLTELMMDNTAYSAIPGLDDGRKVFVVVAFEGVFSITSENKVFLRVQPVLLRYVLLDVDGSLPCRLSPRRAIRTAATRPTISTIRPPH